MNRRVTSTHIPYLPIAVEIPEQKLTAEFNALADTGFSGEIVVPHTAVSDNTAALLQADVRLADGSRVTLPAYLGNVQIGQTAIGPILVMVPVLTFFASTIPTTWAPFTRA